MRTRTRTQNYGRSSTGCARWCASRATPDSPAPTGKSSKRCPMRWSRTCSSRACSPNSGRPRGGRRTRGSAGGRLGLEVGLRFPAGSRGRDVPRDAAQQAFDFLAVAEPRRLARHHLAPARQLGHVAPNAFERDSGGRRDLRVELLAAGFEVFQDFLQGGYSEEGAEWYAKIAPFSRTFFLPARPGERPGPDRFFR